MWINNVDAAVVTSGTLTTGQAETLSSGTVSLTGGQYYPITIGYDEGGGGFGLRPSTRCPVALRPP